MTAATRSIETICLDITRIVIKMKSLGEEAVQYVAQGIVPPDHIRQTLLREEAKMDGLLLEFKEAGGG